MSTKAMKTIKKIIKALKKVVTPKVPDGVAPVALGSAVALIEDCSTRRRLNRRNSDHRIERVYDTKLRPCYSETQIEGLSLPTSFHFPLYQYIINIRFCYPFVGPPTIY